MTRLTAKSRTIFVGVGDRTDVYHSAAEMPPELRKRLHETIRGSNSGTILIADKRGREEIVRALDGKPTDLKCRVAEAVRARADQPAHPQIETRAGWPARVWIELLVPLAVAVTIWSMLGGRF